VFLTPWLLGFFLLTLTPLVASLYLSFTDYALLSPPRWIGLDNYVEMFTGDPRYITSLKVTLRFVLISVPCKLALALLVAMALRKGLRGLGLYRTIYYIPSLLGTSVAIAILWRQIFGRAGVVNGILGNLGVAERNWVSDPSTALWTLILLAIWQFGAPMVIFLAGLNAIPRELYDAAAVDGAGPARQFFHITVPLLTPIIFFNLVLEIIHSFQVFTSAFVVSGGRGGPIDSTLVYTLYLYQRGFTDFDMGYAAAMAWILLLIIGLFTAVLFATARFWVFYGDRG
jgi:multiple sugar transport system permease protein